MKHDWNNIVGMFFECKNCGMVAAYYNKTEDFYIFFESQALESNQINYMTCNDLIMKQVLD